MTTINHIRCGPETWIPDWMIEDLERERQEQLQKRQQPQLTVPGPSLYEEPPEEPVTQRGVIIIPI